MSAGQLAAVLNHVHGLIASWHSDDLTDGQLLEAYLARHDASAFAALVRRHGSLVLSICRNVLHHEHDAEDAFQAAFLILARKAESIRRLASIGGWLCKVAYNVALKARAARRPIVEREAAEVSLSDPLAALAHLELCEALAEELARLPDKFRQPLVLCYLEGLTTGETAQRLRWPTGTVKVRLMQARERLRKQLGQRGFSLSAAGLVSLLTLQTTSAAVPVALIQSVVASATLAPAAGVSAQAAQLAECFLLATQTTKVKSVLAGLLVVGLLLASAGGVAYRSAELPPSQSTPRLPQAETVAVGPANRLFTVDGPSAVFQHESQVTAVAVSPDGRLLAAAGTDGRIKVWDAIKRQSLVALKAVEPARPLVADTENMRQQPPPSLTNLVFRNNETLAALVADTPTGTAVMLWDAHTGKEQGTYPTQSCFAFRPDGAMLATTHGLGLVLWDIKTGQQRTLPDLTATTIQAVVLGSDKRAVVIAEDKRMVLFGDITSGNMRQRLQIRPDLPIPRPRAGLVLSPDGRFATTGGSWEGTLPLWEVATGRQLRELAVAPGLIHSAIFSADGKKLAVAARDDSIHVVDVLTGKTSLLLEEPHDEASVTTLAFAPDGKTLISAATDGSIHCWPLP